MATVFAPKTDAQMTETPPDKYATMFWGYDNGQANGNPTLRLLLSDGSYRSVTTQGNDFNIANKLVQLDAQGKVPTGLMDANKVAVTDTENKFTGANVEAVLQELANNKLSLTGGNITGNLDVAGLLTQKNLATEVINSRGKDSEGNEWIRYESGLQICTGTGRWETVKFTPYGPLWVAGILSFNVSQPFVKARPFMYAVGYRTSIVVTDCYQSSGTVMQCRVAAISTIAEQLVEYKYFVVGTWK